jgi:acetolactate synthase I/II/III large subunit
MPVPQMFDRPVETPKAVVAAIDGHVTHVFGMPGGATAAIFNALHEHPTIRTVSVREESVGSTAAEAYGRLGGKPAVVMGQGAWICGNAGQGLIEALLGSSPVIVFTEMSDGGALSHHGAYQSGSGDYGTWDAVSVLRGVCKQVFVAHQPAQAVQMAQLALKHACQGAPGPVAVVFRGSSLSGTVGPDATPRLYPTKRYLRRAPDQVDEFALQAAVDALKAARRPGILAGNGVRVGQAYGALAALAETLGAPVATTTGGKGVFDERHDLAAGVVGSFGQPTANAAISQADVVLAVGTKLAPIDTCDENPGLIDPGRQTLIQIDSEPRNAAWTLPVDHPLIGSCADVLDRLLGALQQVGANAAQGGASWFVDRVEQRPAAGSGTGVPMVPPHIIDILNRTLPQNAIVTSDAGENRIFMLHWFASRGGGGYLQPASTGGMGYALPAALGAKLARPDQPVIAVVGDGGLAMSLSCLLTALEERLDFGVVVFNNNALSWAVHAMTHPVASQFGEFDFAAIAGAMGFRSARVTAALPLEGLITDFIQREGPWLIDVPTSTETTFREVVQDLAGERWKHGSQVMLSKQAELTGA